MSLLTGPMSAAGGSAGSDGGFGDAAGSSGDASTPGGDLVGELDMQKCPERASAELRQGLDQYLPRLRETTPGTTPDQLRTLREAMLADRARTPMILCSAGI